MLKKPPAPATHQRRDVVFTAYLPAAMHDALVRAAHKEMTSQSAYVRKALALCLHADGLLPEIG
jgi:hypothetical protein